MCVIMHAHHWKSVVSLTITQVAVAVLDYVMALCEVPCAVIPVRPPLTDEEVTDRPKGSPGQKWQAVLVHGGIIFHSVYISHLFCPSINRHTLRSPVNDAAVISSTRSFCLIDLSLFFFLLVSHFKEPIITGFLKIYICFIVH